MSPTNYARNILRISIAQMLQTVGFQSVQSTALDILVEILERYIMLLSKSSHEYSELANRTEPTLDDVACAFEKHKVNISELEEFIKWVDTPDFVLKKHQTKAITNSELVASSITINSRSLYNKTNIKKSYWDYLGYCDDQNNKEILDRQSDEENEYIYDYFPLMTSRRKMIESSFENSENQDLNGTNNGGVCLDSVVMNDLNESISRVNNLDLSKQPEDAFITKNGVKYDTKSWKPYYDSNKNLLNYFKLNKLHKLNSIKNEQTTCEKVDQSSELNQNSLSITKPIPIQPIAKLPKLYHKPRSKFKKQIFLNAVTVYNKQNSSNTILLTASDQIIDDSILSSKIVKMNKNGTKIIDGTDELIENQGINSNNEEKDNENDNKEIENTNGNEENINIVAINEDNNTNHSEINAASLQMHNSINKSLADKVFEAALNKYSLNENNETPKLNLIIKKENVNNSSNNNQIKSKNLADLSNSDKKIPKIKISTSTFAINPTSNEDLNRLDQSYFEEFNTDYLIPGQKSSSNINDDNDNAIDGLDEGVESLNQSVNKKIIEPLIWKPIFNNNSPNSTVPNSPKASIIDLPIETFTISKKADEKPNEKKPSIESQANPKHKKKKKNKDKEKEKNKNKEKEKKHDKKKKKDKDKDKDKSENNNYSSPSKKKDKKLKKLLKKEQKKLEKAAAAAAATATSSVNTSSDQLKEEFSNLTEEPKSNEDLTDKDSNIDKITQPKLPKIKLKINSNQNSNNDTKNINSQSNLVKPLKINFTNINDDVNNQKLNENKPLLNVNSSTNDDEIELGEVVRPEKISKTKSQKDSNRNNNLNHQNDSILKLKIKPIKAPPASNLPSTPTPNTSSASLNQDQTNKSHSVPSKSSKSKDKKLPFQPQSSLIDPSDPTTAHLMNTLDSFLILQSLESQFKNTLLASTLSANLNNDNLLTNSNNESEPGEINLKKRKLSLNNNDDSFLEPNTSTFSNQFDLIKQYQHNFNKQNITKSNASSSNKRKESIINSNNIFIDDIPKQILNKNESFQNNKQHRISTNQEFIVQDEMNTDFESTYEYKKEMQRIKDEHLLRQQINIDMQAFSSLLDQPQIINSNANYPKKISKNSDTSSSNMKIQINQNMKSTVKKNNLNSSLISNDSETIFTPTITPVSKKSKQSPDSNMNKKTLSTSPKQQEFSSTSTNNDNSNSISKYEKMKIIGVQIIDQVTDQVWICPSCNSDRKSPMICCDSCDDWYHWTCIGINKEPPKNQNWYCHKCGTKTNILDNSKNNTQLSPNVINPLNTKKSSPLIDSNITNNDQINYEEPKDTQKIDSTSETSNSQHTALDPSLLFSINDSNNYLNSIKKKKKSLNKE